MKSTHLITVFKNHRKSLIGHCEPSLICTFTFWVGKKLLENAKKGPFWRLFVFEICGDKNWWKMAKFKFSNARLFSLEFQRVLSCLHVVPERKGNWECLLFHLIRLIGLMPIKEVGVLQSSDTRLGEPINVFFGRIFLVTEKQIKTSCKLVDATTWMHYWWGSKDKSINHSLCFINDDLFSLVIRLWKSWKRMPPR